MSTAHESPAKPSVLMLQDGDGEVNYHPGGWEVPVGATSVVSTPVINLRGNDLLLDGLHPGVKTRRAIHSA